MLAAPCVLRPKRRCLLGSTFRFESVEQLAFSRDTDSQRFLCGLYQRARLPRACAPWRLTAAPLHVTFRQRRLLPHASLSRHLSKLAEPCYYGLALHCCRPTFSRIVYIIDARFAISSMVDATGGHFRHAMNRFTSLMLRRIVSRPCYYEAFSAAHCQRIFIRRAQAIVADGALSIIASFSRRAQLPFFSKRREAFAGNA